jgi:hypothetical protein
MPPDNNTNNPDPVFHPTTVMFNNPSPAVSPPSSSQPNSPKPPKFILIISIAGVIAVLGIGLFFINSLNIKPGADRKNTGLPSATQKTLPQQTANSQQAQSAFPEIDVSSNAVLNSVVLYRLAGTLKDIKQTSGGIYELELAAPLANLPKIQADSKTNVYFSGAGKTTPAKVSNLKLGQSVLISLAYDLKNKSWTVNSIGINSQ